MEDIDPVSGTGSSSQGQHDSIATEERTSDPATAWWPTGCGNPARHVPRPERGARGGILSTEHRAVCVSVGGNAAACLPAIIDLQDLDGRSSE